VSTPKRPKKAASSATKAPKAKARKTTAATPRTRRKKATEKVVEQAPEPEIQLDETVPEAEPAVAAAPVEEAAPALAEPESSSVIVTVVPEPGLAARIPEPDAPRPRPAHRRGIFFDVENTSRAADISRVLAHLDLDWIGTSTEFFAVGNWRVVGHDTARLLAHKGASLVHSAPSVGVRDWSDLRIAVAAGVWLAGARPGDVIEIVSDDQAFDAVGDVAASLGVTFRRTSYRALAGGQVEEPVPAPTTTDRRRRGRGGRRGGRGRSERSDTPARREDPRHRDDARRREEPRHRPAVAHHAAPADASATPQTAPHDEIVDVVRDLMVASPGGVTLDALANELRTRGFSRPPGSPRLITRLRRIKELDVTARGLIRAVDPDAPPPAEPSAPESSAPELPAAEPRSTAPAPLPLEPPDDELGFQELEPGEGAPVEIEAELFVPHDGEEPGDVNGDDGGDDTEPSGAAGEAGGEGTARRRRRRGGRRRRGRRNGTPAAVAATPDVV
jgi:hypothetical protein